MDATTSLLVPLVTLIIQGVKQSLPEAVRERYTVLLAMLCGCLVVALYQLAWGSGLATVQAVAQAILVGMQTGLAATGLYHLTGDLKPPKVAGLLLAACLLLPCGCASFIPARPVLGERQPAGADQAVEEISAAVRKAIEARDASGLTEVQQLAFSGFVAGARGWKRTLMLHLHEVGGNFYIVGFSEGTCPVLVTGPRNTVRLLPIVGELATWTGLLPPEAEFLRQYFEREAKALGFKKSKPETWPAPDSKKGREIMEWALGYRSLRLYP